MRRAPTSFEPCAEDRHVPGGRSVAAEGDADPEGALPVVQGLARLHDSVFLLDHDGRLVWMSEGFASRCDDAPRQLGRSWASLLVDEAEASALGRKLAAEGRLFSEPALLRGRAGRPLPANLAAARLGSPARACPTVVIARLRDADDAACAAFPSQLGAILDHASDGVLAVDRSHFVTWANPALGGLTGHRPPELVDRPLALLLRGGDDVERMAAALREEGPDRSREVELRRRDGRPVRVAVSASPLRLPDGGLAGAVVFLRDVGEARPFELELARKNAELEHYVESVSHDLRSPLVSLRGFTRLLREDYGERLDDKGLHFLHRIEEAGRTMENLIHELLELSRIGRGGATTCVVEPRTVLLQLQAELKPRLDAQGVKLVLPADPPPVRCDRTRLYQILSNLVGNALDHMGPRPDALVSVDIREREGAHELEVSDNGRGIAPEHHGRIFEIFQSLGSRADGRRGTGIGLAIVKKIAETQGGRVWVESTPGCGCTFRVLLPGT
jgi:PAS domain S-box-containing protein